MKSIFIVNEDNFWKSEKLTVSLDKFEQLKTSLKKLSTDVFIKKEKYDCVFKASAKELQEHLRLIA